MVDGGGLFWRSARLAESQLEATRIQGALVADSLATVGIDAIGLTPSDLAIGWEQVQQLASQHELPYLAANFTCGGAQPFPSSRVVEHSGVSIGFVGAYLGPVPDDATGCVAAEALPAVQAAIAGLEEAGQRVYPSQLAGLLPDAHRFAESPAPIPGPRVIR